MKFIKIMIMVAIAFTFAPAGLYAAAETVKLSNLPKNAQDSIKQHAQGRKIEKIERDTEDGKTVYNVSFKGKREREEKFKIDADGKVMEPSQAESKDQTDRKNQM